MYDWNRFSSNQLLGNVNLTLSEFQQGVVADVWKPLDTKGELRVIIQFCPVIAPRAAMMAERIPSLRIQLESTVYYPGQIVRGALVYGTNKPKKVHALRLHADGHSMAHWTTGSGKNRRHHYGVVCFFHTSAAFVGPPTGKAETHVVPSGGYVHPFEFTLPINIPHTWEASFGCGNYIRYAVHGFSDIAGKANKVTTMRYRVLASPHTMRHDTSIALLPKVSKSDIQITISGNTTMYTGEAYSLDCHIVNRSNKAIESLQVRLKSTLWLCARGMGTYYRRWSIWSIVPKADWNCSGLPGLPVQPGQEWKGTLQVTIPADLTPSLHSSISPVIQNGYRIGVKVKTAGNIFTKSAGSTKFLVSMVDRYTAFQHIVAPIEPDGQPAQIISAPAPPTIYAALVPAPSTDGKTVTCAGKSFGKIATYPGAFIPAQATHKMAYGNFLSIGMYPTESEWTPGHIPKWIKADEGAPPANEMVDFSASGMVETPDAASAPQ